MLPLKLLALASLAVPPGGATGSLTASGAIEEVSDVLSSSKVVWTPLSSGYTAEVATKNGGMTIALPERHRAGGRFELAFRNDRKFGMASYWRRGGAYCGTWDSAGMKDIGTKVWGVPDKAGTGWANYSLDGKTMHLQWAFDARNDRGGLVHVVGHADLPIEGDR